MKGSSKKFQDWTIDVKKSTIMRIEEMENFQKKYDMPSLPEVRLFYFYFVFFFLKMLPSGR